MSPITRRDFLKLTALGVGSLAFALRPRQTYASAVDFLPGQIDFDDSNLIRIATSELPVRAQPSDESEIYRMVRRDELIHVYEEVVADAPVHNPVWYRVWGGYLHRGRLQRVKILFNTPLDSIPQGTRRLAEVTVPFTLPWRSTKTYGWQALGFPLYYRSVHWIEAVEEGPKDNSYDGPWYRIFDELIGYPYYAPAIHLRPIPPEELEPLTPDVPWEDKLIEVNLTTQTLIAYEYGRAIFQTTISSGIPGRTATSVGKFNIDPKAPSKHMGNGNLFAGIEGYELPGVPWTCFFTGDGQAFHGTYWHENFGAPMSAGCVNMRTEEALWLYRWSRPIPKFDEIYTKGFGTQVEIHY